MPTRFYFPDLVPAAAGATPAVDAGWFATHVNLTRVRLLRGTPDLSTLATQAYAPDSSDDILDRASMFRQYISDPLTNETISGTVRAQIQIAEDNAGNNLFLTVGIRVMTPTNTVRGILLPLTRAATEPTLTLTNRTLAATTLTGVTAVAGDRLVIEVGLAGFPTAGGQTQGHNGTMRWGCSASSGDLPVDEVTTALTWRPWLEFSGTVLTATEGEGTASGSTQLIGIPALVISGLASSAGLGAAAGQYAAALFGAEGQWAQKHFVGAHWQDKQWGGTDPALQAPGTFTGQSHWGQKQYWGQHWQDKHWGGTDPALEILQNIVQADGASSGTGTATGLVGWKDARAATSVGLGSVQAVGAQRNAVVATSTGLGAAAADGQNSAATLNTHWALRHWAANHWVELVTSTATIVEGTASSAGLATVSGDGQPTGALASTHWVARYYPTTAVSHWAAIQWRAGQWRQGTVASEGIGSAVGVATVTGIPATVQGAGAAAGGLGNAVAISLATNTVVVTTVGVGTAQGVSGAQARSLASSAGLGTALATGEAFTLPAAKTQLSPAGLVEQVPGPFAGRPAGVDVLRTQFTPTGLPGQPYGAFTGRPAAPPVATGTTQLMPTALPGMAYGAFTGRQAGAGSAEVDEPLALGEGVAGQALGPLGPPEALPLRDALAVQRITTPPGPPETLTLNEQLFAPLVVHPFTGVDATAAGVAAVSATSLAFVLTQASSVGVGAAGAATARITAAVATAAGVGTASGAQLTLGATPVDASAAGVGTAVGISGAVVAGVVASSVGVGTAAGATSRILTGVGASAGVGVATGAGGRALGGVATASGVGAAGAAGGRALGATATAAGLSTVSASSGIRVGVVAVSDGSSTTTAVSGMRIGVVGTAAGSSSVLGEPPTPATAGRPPTGDRVSVSMASARRMRVERLIDPRQPVTLTGPTASVLDA